MHSLDKHVEQISFQQFVTFREHGQLKGWQPVAKSSISTHFNSRHGKWEKKTHCSLQYSLTNLGDHDTDQTYASLHEPQIRNLQQRDGNFCKHNARNDAELVERTAALKNLLLAGSGCLEFPQRIGGMDSLNKHVQQISIRQCVTFCEHRQLKGWQPHFNQPSVAKSSISTIVHWFAAVT